ncbi:MAG TPA: TIGR04282 family arsenosugar biosynthesis glycosyltransferase [Thermoanaerobaculia bacterium]|nr:TIGR04282 family arsenosugar biosynthesis glycosyltransferase [Thermoanaerobaculia bacterium]
MAQLPQLLLFARPPVLGRVKTRLVPPLTPGQALRLYRAFLEDAARAYCEPGEWRAVLVAESEPDHPELQTLFPSPWLRDEQAPGDLGARLAESFRRAFAEGSLAAVAVGSDHPALPRRLLEQAFRHLFGGKAAVLVPAEDGGYCAIGLAASVPPAEVFRDIPWSTASTLQVTRERLLALGGDAEILEAAYDVDRPADLVRLRQDLASRDPAGPDFPQATAKVLAELTA